MKFQGGRPAVLGGAIAALVPVGIALAGAYQLAAYEHRASQPAEQITREAAQEVLDGSVRAAESGDHDVLCTDFAASKSMCRIALREAVSQGLGQKPGRRPEVVNAEPIGDGNMLLHLRGVNGRGDAYTTDFLVIRGDDQKPRTLMSVYWNGTKLGVVQEASPR